MKKVLIVDDDENFLHSLIDGFKAYANKFDIATACDGLDALEILESQHISLVLTDLKMPRMDGFELVAYLSRNFSEIPVIVMTAFGTPEMEDHLRDMGTFQYIEKPIDFTVLVEKIIAGLQSSSKGYITGVTITSYLQLIEIDKKTCSLSIHAGNKKGSMHFKNGNILSAHFQDQHGIEAAYTIVSWKNVTIEIENSCTNTNKDITESLGFILLESSRRTDEESPPQTVINAPPPVDQDDTDTIDTLNMEELELDLSVDSSATKTVEESNIQAPVQPKIVTTHPALHQFVTLLNAFPEIQSSIISTTEGNILHQDNQLSSNTASFITYVAVATQQIGITIGSSDRQYSTFTLTDDSKLLIICSREIIVGLKIASTTMPEAIANGLRPALRRIKIPKIN